MQQQKTSQGIAYSIQGDIKNAQSVLLLVHGRGMSGDQFRGISVQCATDERAVVIIDLPGHGASDEPEDWSLITFAQAIHTFMTKELGIDRFDLFGHSLGGVIALEYIKQFPTHVRTLVTMGTHLEIESIPRVMIWLDYGIRRLLGDSVLYSWYMFLIWCNGDRVTYDFLKSVWRTTGGHNTERDLAIIGNIPTYDYRSAIGQFAERCGKVAMLVCTEDWIINRGLKESLNFMADQGHSIEFISGGHYTHTIYTQEFVVALRKLLV